MSEQTKVLAVSIPKDLHTAFKTLCVQRGWSMQEKLAEVIKATVNANPAKVARP